MQRYEDLCIPKIRPMWDGYLSINTKNYSANRKVDHSYN